jgi:hypothetical protein
MIVATAFGSKSFNFNSKKSQIKTFALLTITPDNYRDHSIKNKKTKQQN